MALPSGLVHTHAAGVQRPAPPARTSASAYESGVTTPGADARGASARQCGAATATISAAASSAAARIRPDTGQLLENFYTSFNWPAAGAVI